MKAPSAAEIKSYWETHDCSMVEARRICTDRAKEAYIDELEGLIHDILDEYLYMADVTDSLVNEQLLISAGELGFRR